MCTSSRDLDFIILTDDSTYNNSFSYRDAKYSLCVCRMLLPSQPQLGKNRHIYPRAFWRIYAPVFHVRTRRGRGAGARRARRGWACGVSEGACPLARGHPTGAGAPCWRTALLAKSSVLDLLRPPGRERGCAGQHGHFPAPAERRISAGGAAGGYPLFV